MILGLQNRAPARETIQELGEALAQAELGATLPPSVWLAAWLAAWLVEQARGYKTGAEAKYGTFSYTDALDKAVSGLFYARLSSEAVAEYRAVRQRVSTTPLPIPSGHDISALELAASGGAHDTTSPEYTQDDNDEVAKGMRQIRRLALMIARVCALNDALLLEERQGFIEARPHLERAIAYLKKAECCDTWFHAYDKAWDGYFFAELAFKLMREYLEAKEIALPLEPAAWEEAEPAVPADDDDDGDSDEKTTYSDAIQSITEAAMPALQARLRLEANELMPRVAVYHLGLAQSHLKDACQAYEEENWDKSQLEADQACFFAHLAVEAVAFYNEEAGRLAQGLEPTKDPVASGGSDGYCGYSSANIQAAFESWRELALFIARVQAFYAVSVTTFQEGLEELLAAQLQVEAAEDSTDWDKIPRFARKGKRHARTALLMGTAYLKGRRDERASSSTGLAPPSPPPPPFPSIH